MEIFDQFLAAAQRVYPFTRLSLSLTILFSVIILGVAIAGVRGFFARRRAREAFEDSYDYHGGALVEHAPPLLAQTDAGAPVHITAQAEEPSAPLLDTGPAMLAADLSAEPILADSAPGEVALPAPAPLEVEPLEAEPLEAEPLEVDPVPPAAAVAPPPPIAPPSPPSVEEAPVDLTMMRGVGPRLAERLNALGITRFAQIAALDAEEAAALDAKLGANKGQLERDHWIDQAQMLAIGDIAGFEQRFAAH